MEPSPEDAIAAQDLLRKYPDDLFVQQNYIESMWQPAEFPKAIEEYKAKLAANPKSAQLNYLYGVALFGHHSADSIKLFETALQLDPDFPWPHFRLAWLFFFGPFMDKAKAAEHLKVFLDACPDSLEGYGFLGYLDDQDTLRARGAHLRSILEKRDDPEAVSAYQSLWSLEFKVTPLADYDSARRRTAADAQRIRALNMLDRREWYDALEDAYKLANDKTNEAWIKDQRELQLPNSWLPRSAEKWLDAHEHPSAGATPEARRAYFTEELKQTDVWIKDRPNSTSVWSYRLDALTQLDGDPAEIKAAADNAISVAEKDAGPPGPQSYEYFNVVRALAGKHLEPERAVQLAQKGLAQLATEQEEQAYDLWDSNAADFMHVQAASQDVEGLGYIVEAQLQLEQPDKAEIALSQMDERLPDLKSLVGNKQEFKKTYLGDLSAYWACAAHLAELQNRKLDAMAFYENALLARLEAAIKPDAEKKDELAESAKKLWASLGGTDTGWMMWYGRREQELSRASTLTWEETNEPMPKFELADMSGKIWNLESLKGKVTFLNFWGMS